MSLSSVIEKCISIVTGKGSESEQTEESTQQEQTYEQNQQDQSCESQGQDQQQEQIVQPPDSCQGSDI